MTVFPEKCAGGEAEAGGQACMWGDADSRPTLWRPSLRASLRDHARWREERGQGSRGEPGRVLSQWGSRSPAGQYFTATHCISVSKSRHSSAMETEMKFKVAAACFSENKLSLPAHVHRKHCLSCVSHGSLD